MSYIFSNYGSRSLQSSKSFWSDDLKDFGECFDNNDNFSVKYISSGFREINIRNSYGEIIGVESISRLVDKYGSGVVILQKGKKPQYEASLDNFTPWGGLECTLGNCRCGD